MASFLRRRTGPVERGLALVTAVVAVVLLELWTWLGARWLTALSFGGDRDRVAAISARRYDGGSFLGELALTTVLLVAACLALAWVINVWWPYGWRSAAHRKGRTPFTFLPLGAAGFGVLEAIVAASTVGVDGGALRVSDAWSAVIAAIGQLKWLLLFVAGFALFLTMYGALRFRRLTFEPKPPTTEVVHGDEIDLPVEGSAICLSGGGIRSAAFTWGALAELERRRPLAQFDRMYSVSGGGYAAMSFTASTDGLRAAPKFYADAQLPLPGTQVADTRRYEHVRLHQKYLTNGPGGLVRALGLAVLSIALNVFVVFLGVTIVAVPIGVLARNELGGQGVEIPDGVMAPILVTFVFALAGLLLSAAIDSADRRIGLAICLGLAAAGVVIWVIRVAVPWLAGNVSDLFNGDLWKRVLPAFVIWAGTLVFAIVRPRLTKMAVRLGGLVTVVAMVLGIAVVARITIDESWHWGGRSTFLDDARWLLPICLALLVAIDFSGVQWWSFHPLYRNRLATTFVFKEDDGELVAQRPPDWATWSDVAGRTTANKPVHVVCAATHRRTTDVTGLTSISFTFSPEGVEMYEPHWDEVTGKVTVRRYHRDAVWLSTAIGAMRASLPSKKRATVAGAAAMSGAAFNSVMGRHSKGTTDSLLALLNLRLGVWMPNPRFDSMALGSTEQAAFTRPGLRYLFHEVIGHFDTTDPFVQVSDGGHWENLGLVEALRARHRHIVVVDASGDHFQETPTSGLDGGLGTLFEAVDLARIELHTDIKVDQHAFDMMRPNHRTGRCERNWMECDIVYHRDPGHNWVTGCNDLCRTGKLLFVKATVSDRTPESVLSFANTDRVFPSYSTGDQFLKDAQFRSLVGLGEAAMHDAFNRLGAGWFAT